MLCFKNVFYPFYVLILFVLCDFMGDNLKHRNRGGRVAPVPSKEHN